MQHHPELTTSLQQAKLSGSNFVAYDATITQTKGRADSNNCAVRAITVALDIPMDEVKAHFSSKGRKYGAGTKTVDINKYLIGKAETVFAAGGFTTRTAPITLQEAIARFPTGRYIFSMRKHLVACIDGVVVDLAELDINRKYQTVDFSTGLPITSRRIEHKVWKAWRANA